MDTVSTCSCVERICWFTPESALGRLGADPVLPADVVWRAVVARLNSDLDRYLESKSFVNFEVQISVFTSALKKSMVVRPS